jgi:hypothetical protein
MSRVINKCKLVVMNFKDVILRVEVSHRGGGIEIDLTKFGFGGHRMTAYDDDLSEIAQELRKYYHDQSNPDDEWSGMTYEQRQNMPKSAY